MTQDLKDLCLIDKSVLQKLLNTYKYAWENGLREVARTGAQAKDLKEVARVHEEYAFNVPVAVKALAQDLSGVRLVSLEPTEDQHEAARDWAYEEYGKPIGKADAAGLYKAMITAALKPEEK